MAKMLSKKKWQKSGVETPFCQFDFFLKALRNQRKRTWLEDKLVSTPTASLIYLYASLFSDGNIKILDTFQRRGFLKLSGTRGRNQLPVRGVMGTDLDRDMPA